MRETFDTVTDTCMICGNMGLECTAPSLTAAVTSDCSTWPVVIQPQLCPSCGHVQKQRNLHWQEQARAIYSAYSITEDQSIVTVKGAESRKQFILKQFTRQFPLPPKGKLLDIGCGNGNFFSFFHELYPEWNLYGSEYGDKYADQVLARPGVVKFNNGPLESMSAKAGSFDFVTYFFVIEHLSDPVGNLQRTRDLLSDDGLLLIHTDDLQANPFDLAVTDHVSHFVMSLLLQTVQLAGLAPVMFSRHWIPKQLSVVAKKCHVPLQPRQGPDADNMRCLCTEHLKWLEAIRLQAERITRSAPLGILGAAIAGTWLAQTLGDAEIFFVDEAPEKGGASHMGLPVYALKDAPSGSAIFLAFPPTIANSIYERLNAVRPDLTFIVPDGTLDVAKRL